MLYYIMTYRNMIYSIVYHYILSYYIIRHHIILYRIMLYHTDPARAPLRPAVRATPVGPAPALSTMKETQTQTPFLLEYNKHV